MSPSVGELLKSAGEREPTALYYVIGTLDEAQGIVLEAWDQEPEGAAKAALLCCVQKIGALKLEAIRQVEGK